jgi:hypothetical protein
MVSTNLWEPAFEGEDEEWGDRAMEALRRHLRYCDVKGPQLRFSNAYRIASRLLDVDGDCFRVKIIDPRSGLPKVQSFEAHRIASPGNMTVFQPATFREFDAETFRFARSLDGAQVKNGVVLGEYGQQLAIIITDGTALHKPIALIPEGRYWHISEPEWFSENRGLPKLIYAIYDWYDLKETRDAEKIKQKSRSAIAMTEDTSTGFKPAASISGQSMSASNPKVIELEKGLIRYFKAGSGQGLKFLDSNSPGDSWQRFLSSVEQSAFYALGWNRALLDPSGLSSANMHAVAEQINYSIFKRFDNLEFFARQELQWHISGLINVGRIPAHPEWYKWTVAPPPEYQVNQSRNNYATLESLRAGTETHPRIIRAKGGDPTKWLREQARFIKLAKQISEEEGIPYEDLVQLGKPGDPVAQPQQQTQPTE